MKSVVIGSTVYANGKNSFSLESAEVVGIDVVNDTGEVMTWIRLRGGDEDRSIRSGAFFKNYTDVVPFFKLGVTYRNKNGSFPVRFQVIELLKSDKPTGGQLKGLYAVAKRIEGNGAYSYIILDENSFEYMVQV